MMVREEDMNFRGECKGMGGVWGEWGVIKWLQFIIVMLEILK